MIDDIRHADMARGEWPSAEMACQRCKRPNVWSWHAPSPLWNRVMRDPATGQDRWGIVCPPCFAELTEEAGLGREIDGKPRLVWCFRPHDRDVADLWTDRDGRTWDPERCLWVEPDEPRIADRLARYVG